MNTEFNINQIVKGKVAGTFVILGFRNFGGEIGAQVKPVNPKNHEEVGIGEIFMPLNSLISL